jgi:hypothetical protein
MTKDRELKTARIDGWDFGLMHNENGYEVLVYDLDGYPEDLDEAGTEAIGKPETDALAIIAFTSWALSEQEKSGPAKPDWEAQARYDEQHGTINGYDAAVIEMQELTGDY